MRAVTRGLLVGALLAAATFVPAAAEDLCGTMRAIVAALTDRQFDKLEGDRIGEIFDGDMYRSRIEPPSPWSCEVIHGKKTWGDKVAANCRLEQPSGIAALDKAKEVDATLQACFPKARRVDFGARGQALSAVRFWLAPPTYVQLDAGEIGFARKSYQVSLQIR